MLNLNRWAIFASAAKLQSFSLAAEYLGTSKPTVSKQIAALEEKLGTKLFNRNTRRLQLTEAGEALYLHCRAIMQEYENAEDLLETMRETPTGVLNISAPSSYVQQALSALSQEFLAKYPDISINYHTHQLASDYFPMGADLAIIVHKLKDSSLCYRKLGDVRHVMCASPQYLAKNGKPKTPQELKNFNFIAAHYAHVPNNYEWGMTKDGVFYPAEVSGNLRVDDSMTVKKLVIDGAGITSLPSFTIREELAEGKLALCLEDYEVGLMPVYVVFPEKKYMPPKVRVFLDMLVAWFEASPMFK